MIIYLTKSMIISTCLLIFTIFTRYTIVRIFTFVPISTVFWITILFFNFFVNILFLFFLLTRLLDGDYLISVHWVVFRNLSIFFFLFFTIIIIRPYFFLLFRFLDSFLFLQIRILHYYSFTNTLLFIDSQV